MPKTEASDIPLGTPAPDFRLADAEGRLHGPSTCAEAPALLVAFLSNRCPYVLGIRSALADFARRNAPRGLRVIAVNSNDADARPEEAAERVAAEAQAQGYPFPYLKDGFQAVARAFGAACTPDLFPEMMAQAIDRGDLNAWAASRDIVTTRAETPAEAG